VVGVDQAVLRAAALVLLAFTERGVVGDTPQLLVGLMKQALPVQWAQCESFGLEAQDSSPLPIRGMCND
jgi:hypothetical protein